MSSQSSIGARTTYFLGAGASAAVTQTPVTTENLLQTALTRPEVERVAGLNACDMVREFVDFLSARGCWPVVDDVLSLVDESLAQNLALSPAWPTEKLGLLRRHLDVLIYACIQETANPFVTIPPSSRGGSLLTELCERMDPLRTAVVTLNWDCLVEHAFLAARGHREDLLDYGVECIRQNGERHVAASGRALLVLKPHGSVSWGYCKFCGALTTDLGNPYNFSVGRTCGRCLQPLSTVLVPPVAQHHMWPPVLNAVWERLEAVIQQSDRIVLIGYSLPPQDVHVRMRLVRALSRRSLTGNVPPIRLEIVFKQTSGPGRANEKQRYQTILGGDGSRALLSFFDNGFEDWMARHEA